MSKINDIAISQNFKLHEFECKDGSHQVVLDPKLLQLTQKLRDRLGQSMVIESAYRNVTHNKKVKGSANSQHLLGKAIDVHVKQFKGMTVDQLANMGRAVGFTGIFKYSWGCHFDVRDKATEGDFR